VVTGETMGSGRFRSWAMALALASAMGMAACQGSSEGLLPDPNSGAAGEDGEGGAGGAGGKKKDAGTNNHVTDGPATGSGGSSAAGGGPAAGGSGAGG